MSSKSLLNLTFLPLLIVSLNVIISILIIHSILFVNPISSSSAADLNILTPTQDDTVKQDFKTSKPSMSLNIIKLNDDNFESEVRKGNWLIGVFADWCPSCPDFTNELNKFAEESFSNLGDDALKVGLVNITDSPITSARLLIFKIPSLFFFENDNLYILDKEYFYSSKLMTYFSEKEWNSALPRHHHLGPFSFIGNSLACSAKFADNMVSWFDKTKQTYPPYFVYGCLALIPILLLLCIAYLTYDSKKVDDLKESSDAKLSKKRD